MCKSASIDYSIDVSKIHFTYTMSHVRARRIFFVTLRKCEKGRI
jgi:hypothetical protein